MTHKGERLMVAIVQKSWDKIPILSTTESAAAKSGNRDVCAILIAVQKIVQREGNGEKFISTGIYKK